MYNINKNKYFVYIMADTNTFKDAICKAYNSLNDNTSKNDFKVEDDTNLKESDIIKILIDKLNEISDAADAEATNNKKAISITKFNYGYYLNTIEDKEYPLFLKLLLNILNSFKYLIQNLIQVLFIHINISNKIFNQTLQKSRFSNF